MSLNLKRDFKYAVAMAAAMALSSLSLVPAAHANPPPRDSAQWNLMHPFASFITKMYTHPADGVRGQWCCDWSDGRGDMQEETYTAPDGTTHYRVLATREAYGAEYYRVIPPEGLWVDVPPKAVLSSKDADEECKAERTADVNSTCKTPDFNILWLSPYDGHVYCYWPEPKLGMLQDKYAPTTGKEIKLAQSAPAVSAPAPAL
jgi:hypothetical protein